ncbi:hypothetical protein SNE40_010493 [Patella caerulea]|uniref:UBX domain-containing protein 4 n=1 Tax=Patella caerulea TaxID=87958 RepID=A0AAN8K157_PATCE
MKWFEGQIAQAVQTSKAKKSVFIVYISGENKDSEEVSKAIEDKRVEEVCEKGDCVAVKIKANSADCGFFSQIYPVVVVPSIFFIGENGVPLEVTGGAINTDDLVKKITSVIELNKSKIQSNPTTPAQGDGDISQASSVTEPTTPDEALPSTSSSQVSSPQPTQEELKKRVEKAEEIIERKREERIKKEYEDARRKEEEKRQLGKDVQKLRQFQKEREILEVQKQLKKEKDEDKIARQKVKEQIARDRAERAAKFNKEKKEEETALSEAKKAKLQAEQKVKEEAEAKRSESARIQFRLPDGSSVPQTFPSSETLQTVYNFISQHIGEEVVLSTTFPRRTYNESDLTQTLITLQLAPSAVVMVVPRRRTTAVQSRSMGSSDIISLLLAPFMFILSLLRSLFGGSSSSSSQPSSSTAYSQQSSSSSSATGGDRQSNQAFKRQTDGNIRRFRNAQDDDDENATWNGNSTQQM